MDMAIIQPPISVGQPLNGRFAHKHQQKINSHGSYAYDTYSNRDSSVQHHHQQQQQQQQIQSMTCPPPLEDYSLHQSSTDASKMEPPQATVNSTEGSGPIQPRWCHFHHHHLDTGNEYTPLNTSYDTDLMTSSQQPTGSIQQVQTDGYYNQDLSRGFYLNPAAAITASTSATSTDTGSDYQNYPVYGKATNWTSTVSDDPSSCTNYVYYEPQNQQENIHDKLIYYQQQTSHQYPSDQNYDATGIASHTGGNHEHYLANHHHHVQSKQSANYDSNHRLYYYDRSCSFEQASGKSLQHSHTWAQPQSNAESCGLITRLSSSLSSNPQNEQGKSQDINLQSWPSESQQLAGENQVRQQPDQQQQQQARLKSMSKSCNNSKQSQSGNGSVLRTNQCRVCGRNYARPSTLKTHLRTHTNERPFKCNVCLKTFSQAANLTAHQRVHTGERPFSCPICGRQFSQSSSVITHLRTHSGERPYRCSMCSRTFSDSSTLTKHCRIHSGEKPYQCDYCPLNFSQSGNLSRHLKLHLMAATSGSSSSATSSNQSSSSYNSACETRNTPTKDRPSSLHVEPDTSRKMN